MRVVSRVDDLSAAWDAASREALAAFGDGEVFCERYLPTGHHVEVQILADMHGTIWTLGDRECSLQRRHQKVIEEAPSFLAGEARDRLLEAGRTAARAVGYVGAGTVEFLADDHGDFWFLEMNTRLQVEHPVTECVTGTDLVGLQLDVANGRPLTGPPPAVRGHAVEARLYAESPLDDWQPRTGTIAAFDIPTPAGIRVDSGVEAGTVVGTSYDALLAKVIAYADTRADAVRLLGAALRRARIHGVTTNRELLVATLSHPGFETADTSFYATYPPAVLLAGTGLDPALAALIAALSDAAFERGPLLTGVRSGFRNIPVGYRTRAYTVDGQVVTASYRLGRDGWETPDLGDLTLVAAEPDRVVLEVDGVRRHWDIGRFDDHVVLDGPSGSAELRRVPRFTDPAAPLPSGALVAPMPGTVVRIEVREGESVAAGQALVSLEAMKMEHTVRAPAAGTVSSVPVALGAQVAQGTALVVIDG